MNEQELLDKIDELEAAIKSIKNRLNDHDEWQYKHIGNDWGRSGVTPNSPHPNQSVDTAEYGGGVMRLDRKGAQIIDDSSIGLAAIWGMPTFSSDPLQEDLHTFWGFIARPDLNYAVSYIAAKTTGVGGGKSAAFGSVSSLGTQAVSYPLDGFLALGPGGIFTISSGSISPTVGYVLVATEGGAATDNLDTIDATTLTGSLLLLQASDTNDTVVVRHDVDNIHLNGGDFSLDDAEKWILLIAGANDDWYELARSGGGGGMNKVTGSGYQVYPSAATGIDPANSGSAWTNGSWSEVVASTGSAVSVIGIYYDWDQFTDVNSVEAEIDIGTGAAASETAVTTIPVAKRVILETLGGNGGDNSMDFRPVFFPAPIEVATSTRIAVRVRSSNTTVEPANIRLIYVAAASLVSR